MRARGSGAAATGRFGLLALLALGAIGAALVSQHRFGMEPCPWCTLQRLVFLAIAAACLVGCAWRSRTGQIVAAGATFLLALAGVAAALWQHFQAARSASCNLTFADRLLNATTLPTLLPNVFEPRASCADAAVDLWGVPYEFWSLALFIVMAGVALSVLASKRGREELLGIQVPP